MYIYVWFFFCFIYILIHIYIYKSTKCLCFIFVYLCFLCNYVLIYLKDFCLLCSVSCIVNAYFFFVVLYVCRYIDFKTTLIENPSCITSTSRSAEWSEVRCGACRLSLSFSLPHFLLRFVAWIIIVYRSFWSV